MMQHQELLSLASATVQSHANTDRSQNTKPTNAHESLRISITDFDRSLGWKVVNYLGDFVDMKETRR
jgi:hypothetical protein